jgi:hypothetical protein
MTGRWPFFASKDSRPRISRHQFYATDLAEGASCSPPRSFAFVIARAGWAGRAAHGTAAKLIRNGRQVGGKHRRESPAFMLVVYQDNGSNVQGSAAFAARRHFALHIL